jgi:Flp pilus assembly protein TadD
MISTRRRLEFASGYIALGMLNEASDELEAIEGVDRLEIEVMKMRAELYVATKQWDLLLAVAREVTRLGRDDQKGWILTAYALRELGRVPEAKAVLFEAEPLLGPTCEVLHYNLACYHCLLGELTEAKRRLALACGLNAEWKDAALNDEDLKNLWDDIAAIR